MQSYDFLRIIPNNNIIGNPPPRVLFVLRKFFNFVESRVQSAVGILLLWVIMEV